MAVTKLSRELQRAVDHRRSRDRSFNLRKLAVEAGFPDEKKAHGWVRSVVSGAIEKPPAAKLKKLGPPLGIPVERLLALTDQLGEAAPAEAAPADMAAVVAAINRQAEAVERQAAATEKLVTLMTARLDRIGDERRAELAGLAESIGALLIEARDGSAQGASGAGSPQRGRAG